jgi:hypothetical protein
MVKCSVFFEARTEFLNIIQTSFGFIGLRLVTEKMALRAVFERGEEYCIMRSFTTRTLTDTTSVMKSRAVRLEGHVARKAAMVKPCKNLWAFRFSRRRVVYLK